MDKNITNKMRVKGVIIMLLIIVNLTNGLNIRRRNRSALDILGTNMSGFLTQGNSAASGGTVLDLNGRTGSATNTNSASTAVASLLGAVRGSNSGSNASTMTGTGSVRAATSGDNSAAVTDNGRAASSSSTEAANVIDVLDGTATSGTITKAESGIDKVGANSATEKTEATTMGTITGDGVGVAATTTTGGTLVEKNLVAGTNSVTTGGLLDIRNGSGNLSTSTAGGIMANMGNSRAAATSTGNTSASVSTGGSVSTTSTSSNNVIIS